MILAEFVVGRRANLNAIDAFDRLGHSRWKVVGALGVFTGFWVLSYYSVIGGWVIRYLLGSVTEAHVYADADEPEGYYIEKILPAATVQEMLAQVQYFPNDLQRRMRSIVQAKIKAGALRPKAGMQLLEHYASVFQQHTYLER